MFDEQKTNGNPLQGASLCFFDGLRRRLRCRCTKPPNDIRSIKTIKLKWWNVSLPRMPPKYKEQVVCFKSKLCHVSSKAGSHQHISTYFNIFQHHMFALFSKYNAIFKRQFLEVKLRVTWIWYLAFTTSLADRQLASNTQGMASKKPRRSDQNECCNKNFDKHIRVKYHTIIFHIGAGFLPLFFSSKRSLAHSFVQKQQPAGLVCPK